MSATPPPKAAPPQEGDDEDDEGHMDVTFIKGFADKIQRAPQELSDLPDALRPKIIIPKRGEKDFEPLQETVNLQEMMLQNSRQALFDALQGVRGMGGKSLSHALVTPSSPFPQLIVSRGHVLDTLGITVRRPGRDGRIISRIELLPEEAMYLAERGSLQIWNGRDPVNEDEQAAGIGGWCDEEFGIKGAIEMSVLEVFGAFMGKEALSWQRYQAYAYLKRLGYTVQRTRQFIPAHFLGRTEDATRKKGIAGIWAALSRAVARLFAPLRGILPALSHRVSSVGLELSRVWSSNPVRSTILGSWSGQTYSSIFAHLRFIPAGHSDPVPLAPASMPSLGDSQYAPLVDNPYLPFFHVWKPVTAWSKAKWDRGSPVGLEQQRPDYAIAAIESRNTPLPTLRQLDDIFQNLPDEPKGPPRRIGPQYENRRPHARREEKEETQIPWYRRMLPWTPSEPLQEPYQNPMAALRNGDRAIVVAVNDSGNTGWVRFGRSGFESFPMV